MVQITFVHKGQARKVACETGVSLMNAALDNDIVGIIGECGGNMACATCHVYIREDWASTIQSMDAMEDALLDGAFDRDEHSRLACQIVITDEHNGLVAEIPDAQV